MQTKTDHLALIAEKTGLRISKENTKVMRPNSKQREKIKLKDVKLDAVHSFIYEFREYRHIRRRSGRRCKKQDRQR